eukprot:TRINITY_DN25669_c0_g1_i1.p1 TRINITY_DN25669_c0_g1~~TRINITY_DN25669_c0_g1_i1.p1  ORF type:complete len:545 (+),score=70.95 TRINITY_DN25669_c0_g1_i1:175-1635(+)
MAARKRKRTSTVPRDMLFKFSITGEKRARGSARAGDAAPARGGREEGTGRGRGGSVDRGGGGGSDAIGATAARGEAQQRSGGGGGDLDGGWLQEDTQGNDGRESGESKARTGDGTSNTMDDRIDDGAIGVMDPQVSHVTKEEKRDARKKERRDARTESKRDVTEDRTGDETREQKSRTTKGGMSSHGTRARAKRGTRCTRPATEATTRCHAISPQLYHRALFCSPPLPGASSAHEDTAAATHSTSPTLHSTHSNAISPVDGQVSLAATTNAMDSAGPERALSNRRQREEREQQQTMLALMREHKQLLETARTVIPELHVSMVTQGILLQLSDGVAISVWVPTRASPVLGEYNGEFVCASQRPPALLDAGGMTPFQLMAPEIRQRGYETLVSVASKGVVAFETVDIWTVHGRSIPMFMRFSMTACDGFRDPLVRVESSPLQNYREEQVWVPQSLQYAPTADMSADDHSVPPAKRQMIAEKAERRSSA